MPRPWDARGNTILCLLREKQVPLGLHNSHTILCFHEAFLSELFSNMGLAVCIVHEIYDDLE